MAIKLVEQTDKKGKPNGMFDLFIKSGKDTPVIAFYAQVHEPKLKFQSDTDKEYSVDIFVTREDAEILDDDVRLNKTLFEVDVTKNKKKKIKYSSEDYPGTEGMVGFRVTCNEFTKKGKKNIILVGGEDGKKLPKETLIGNGSKVHIKCFGYRNDDDLLVISLKALRVVELVPYESSGGGNQYNDDEIGIHYDPSEDEIDDELKGDEPDFGEDDDDDDSDY